MSLYLPQLQSIIMASRFKLSDVLPSDWAAANRVMTSEVSPFPGKFSYDRTPYLKEIVDTLHPGHPARIVAVMKGAQIGFSTGVIEAGLGYIISENPGPTLFLTGHADLTEEAMTGKIDQMIDSCGLRKLIKPNVLRKKTQRTGDTNTRKEFPGGYIIGGHANHKTLRQRSVKYGFFDDFEAMPNASKESGSTTRMIEQRFAAYADKMKIYYISTPEIDESSNIYPVFMKGDQRKFHVPCPCCGDFIALEWEVPLANNEKEKAGITWLVDANGKLVESSVGYLCQSCGGFFNDSLKQDLLQAGYWRPTAEPEYEGYYSYHLSSLYAPAGMYNWRHYVRQYLEAYKPGREPDEKLVQTFVNLCLGETYKPSGKAIKANDLQKHCRNYEPFTVPEKLSIADGNGNIVLLTLACDLNGKLDDARLDWEIVGWAETGSSYSIAHGSIGTFVKGEGSMANKVDREHWTYEHGKPNSVWPELEKIVTARYQKDTGKAMRIMISGMDTGYLDKYGWQWVDTTNGINVVGVKGNTQSRAMRLDADMPLFKAGKERNKLYILESNLLKDEAAKYINLKWDPANDKVQPHGFMNFPSPAMGLYRLDNYFSHFEAEHRVIDTKSQIIKYEWRKKNSSVENHLFDCRCYNIALREIFCQLIGRELKIQKATWADVAPKLKMIS